MIKALVKFIFYIGFVFFGGGFLIAFSLFIAYNGLGPFFKYKEVDRIVKIHGDISSLPEKLVYEYEVNGKKYNGFQGVSLETASLDDFTEFTIVYNEVLPNLSMIKELKDRETKAWSYTVNMIPFGFFFLLIFSIYRFSDLDKWIGLYTRGEFVSSKKK